MVFGALPQEILCACTKEFALAPQRAAYTALMNDSTAQKIQTEDLAEIDQLAEAFLDLWQDNIRCWSEERDLFTLQSLIEAVRKSTLHEGGGNGS